MLYKFDNTIIDEIKSFYHKYQDRILEIHLCDTDTHIEDELKKMLDGKDKYYLIRLGNESFHTKEQKRFVENLIEDYLDLGYRMKLSTSSINKSKYEFHPLTNLHLHWKELEQRRDLSWKTSDSVEAFPSSRYDYKKKLEFNKAIKSILSVRKTSEYRKYLFSLLEKDNNSILRYADYAFGMWTETDDDVVKSKNFPIWYELLDEYENSIFSFIYETEHTTDSTMDCQISEKTIKAMLSGNIPIVLGQHKFPTYINDMGLYIANDDFGFNDSVNFKDRLESFALIYNKVKSLSFDECKKLWIDNQNKIQKNYDIISNLLYRDWYNETKD